MPDHSQRFWDRQLTAVLFLFLGAEVAGFAIKLYKAGTPSWWSLVVSAALIAAIYKDQSVSPALKRRLGIICLSIGIFAELIRMRVDEHASSLAANVAAGTFATAAWFLTAFVPDDASSGRRA